MECRDERGVLIVREKAERGGVYMEDFDRRLGIGGGGGAGKNNRGQKNGSEGIGAVLGRKKCQSGGREGGVGVV